MVLPLYTTRTPLFPIQAYLALSLSIIFAIDLVRFKYPPVERLYERVVGFLMRDTEKVCSSRLSLCANVTHSHNLLDKSQWGRLVSRWRVNRAFFASAGRCRGLVPPVCRIFLHLDRLSDFFLAVFRGLTLRHPLSAGCMAR